MQKFARSNMDIPEDPGKEANHLEKVYTEKKTVIRQPTLLKNQ
jgi:hypothetical protein